MIDSIWSNTEILERWSKIIPYFFIVLGCIVAAFGQYASSIIDNRITVLKEQRKFTPPKIEVELILSNQNEFFVALSSFNSIPFKCKWTLLNSKNNVLSGIMMNPRELHPSKEKKNWQFKETPELDNLIDNIIVLNFKYESIYAAEKNFQANLGGHISKRYVYKENKLYPIK